MIGWVVLTLSCRQTNFWQSYNSTMLLCVLIWFIVIRLCCSDGVFTCDRVCSYNGPPPPMPHAYVWAMGCPFWWFSVKLTAIIQQHHVVMGLDLDWSYLAALVTQVFTWDGVHTYNGHPMPHSYGWAMGCPFRGLSIKINSFTAAPCWYGSWSGPAIWCLQWCLIDKSIKTMLAQYPCQGTSTIY